MHRFFLFKSVVVGLIIYDTKHKKVCRKYDKGLQKMCTEKEDCTITVVL